MRTLTLIFAVMAGAHAAMAQVARITVTDGAGSSLGGAVALVVGYDPASQATHPRFPADSAGRITVRLPVPRDSIRTFVLRICAPRHTSVYVRAPFATADTLRIGAALRPLRSADGVSPLDPEPCGKVLAAASALTVDTSTAIGTTVADALRIALRNNELERIGKSAGADSTRVVVYRRTVMDTLEHTLRAARDPHTRARAAFAMLHFATTGARLPTSLQARIRTALPPGSRVWLTIPFGVWIAQTLFDEADSLALTKYLGGIADSSGEPEIRSEARALLASLAHARGDDATAQAILARMEASEPGYPFTLLTASRYGAGRPLRVGAKMPSLDFPALPDTSSHITSASFAGRLTLIDFWGTWCGPCMAEMQTLHAAYRKYHSRGLEILSVAADESPAVVNDFRAKRWPMPWLNAFAPGAATNPRLREIGVLTYPRTVLVDRRGVIVALDAELRGTALDSTIARFVNR